MDESLRKQLKAEIESFASLAEAEKEAPPVGGSGRSNDFFNQHIQRLAEIYDLSPEETKQGTPKRNYGQCIFQFLPESGIAQRGRKRWAKPSGS